MKKLLLILALTSCAQAQTLVGYEVSSGTGSATLSSFPLGSFRISLRVHNLPTTAQGSDIILFQIQTYSGLQILCKMPAGVVGISCYDDNGAPVGGYVSTYSSDVRIVYTRYYTTATSCNLQNQPLNSYGCTQTRVDVWSGDCSHYGWSNLATDYNASEPTTTNGPLVAGGSGFILDFIRADVIPTLGVLDNPDCPADSPAATAANFDFRFEGSTNVDITSNHYTLTGTGITYPASTTYNPAAFVRTSSTAPDRLPVVPFGIFTLTSHSVTFDTATNHSVPSSCAWTQISGPASTINSPSSCTTTVSPSAAGSPVYQLSVTDTVPNTGTVQLNVGVVDSDVNGNVIQTNAELNYLIGNVPLYGTSPWPWYEITEATDADIMDPFWEARPAPATLFTGTGKNDAYFSGYGAYTGLYNSSYDFQISSTGTPDNVEWRKNGGSWSAAQPITNTNCFQTVQPILATDGVMICFNSTTGHTTSDMWSWMPPQAGTWSITPTGNNKTNSVTGEIVGTGSGPCGTEVEAIGTGTHASTGTSLQALISNNYYWWIWDINNDGTFQGVLTTQLSVIDDTHICMNGIGGNWALTPSLQTTGYIQSVESGTNITASIDFHFNFTYSGQPSTSFNYYNAEEGVARLYIATNLAKYQTEFKNACTNWWIYGANNGYNSSIARNSGYDTLMACASMFTYNWWGLPDPDNISTGVPGSGLAYYLTRSTQAMTSGSPLDRYTLQDGDVRETVFHAAAVAKFTHVYPAHTASPSTTRTTWCGYSSNFVNYTLLNPWNPPTTTGLWTVINSGSDGYWQDSSYGNGNNMTAPQAGVPTGNILTASMGTAPWRDSGLGNIAMIEFYYPLLVDCTNGTLAASVQTAAIQTAAYIWDYGRSPDGGLFYNEHYLSYGQNWSKNQVTHNLESTYGDMGTLTVSGTTVTYASGNGTEANAMFVRKFGTGIISNITLAGTNYAVNSVVNGGKPDLVSGPANGNYSGWTNPATVTVYNGSTMVTGMGTNFKTMFNCNGTDYIGILGNNVGGIYNNNGVYQVDSCLNNNQLTIDVPYVGLSTWTTSDFSWSNATPNGFACTPSILSIGCEKDEYSGKSLAADYTVSMSQAYLWTASASWRNKAEYALGSLFGGAQGGPNFLGPNYGPQSALAANNFDSIYLGCNDSRSHGQAPCTQDGNGSQAYLAKEIGMSMGAGEVSRSISNYLTVGTGGSVFPSNSFFHIGTVAH